MGCGSTNTQEEKAPETIQQAPQVQQPAKSSSKGQLEVTDKQKLNIQEKKDQQNTQKLTTEHMMVPKLELKMHGGKSLNIDSSFVSDAQVLICAPKGHEILIQVRSAGKIAVAILSQRQFPLTSLTDVLLQQQGENEMEIKYESQDISGFVICVGSEGRELQLTLDGQGRPILSLMHVEPLP